MVVCSLTWQGAKSDDRQSQIHIHVDEIMTLGMRSLGKESGPRACRDSCCIPGTVSGIAQAVAWSPTHPGDPFAQTHDLRKNLFKMFLEMCIKSNKAFEI